MHSNLVYARWTIHPNRSTHALYTVNHAGGATPVTVNQEVNGGQWNLLGTFTLNAGSSHSVVLAIQDDGYVIADAIKVVPQGAAPSTATWTPTVPTAKAYHVYTRWTAHPNRATDAKYTVTHAGGETTVTINQEVNNGAWVQLGTFNLAPASGHKVSLTDQANGYVIADAIRLIGTDEPQANSATWSPSLTGEHQVYAKWTANPNRATNATYTVTHAGGTTPVAVNQQANGGQFNLLGTFTLTAASTITLTDNANGFVIADAIQLIATAATPLALYFVHTDHLNSPRLITNSTGQAVWSWANDDPFGANAPNENPSGLGLFSCNLRLPGQYFDKETNLHYNYFRDYEPWIGRYIESDPIGLAGGLNGFVYVANAPLVSIDPSGLKDCKFVITPGSPFEKLIERLETRTWLSPFPGKYDSKEAAECMLSSPAPGNPRLPRNVEMVKCVVQTAAKAIFQSPYAVFNVTQDIYGQMLREVLTEEWCRENSCENYKPTGFSQRDIEKLSNEYFKYTRWIGVKVQRK